MTFADAFYSTRLPMARALWVPKNGLPLLDISERPSTPTTPLDQPDGVQSPAWDPSSVIPGESSHPDGVQSPAWDPSPAIPGESSQPDVTPEPQPGAVGFVFSFADHLSVKFI
jgi:hypothetical protein